MAFANLFTILSDINEGVDSPGKPASPHRTNTETDKRGKRKPRGEQTGPHMKKQCYQFETTRTHNYKATDYQTQNTNGEHAGFTKDVVHNHSDKAGHNNMGHKGQKYITKHNHNVNKQQQQRNKTEEQRNQHQQKDQWTNRGRSHQTRTTSRKGGGGSRNKNNKQHIPVKRTRFMTQEFKDQHALMVDGRLLCRHFLWGRCIKAAAQTFPCKFFHRKGNCSQGADCRFSHEPLDDITNQLLDEAIKRENDLYELAKKTEQKSSGQPVNTEESEIIEANETPDILIQPLRPNFYNSAEPNAQQEALLSQAEESADVTEEAILPLATATQSNNHKHEEPVCYSVEAVLGPQLSKPFSALFTTAGSQDSSPLSVPQTDCTSGSPNQSEVPYSVDAVLRSCKSLHSSNFGHSTTTSAAPIVQTVSYATNAQQLCSENHEDKVLSLVNAKNEPNKFQEKAFKSLSTPQVHSGPISKTCPDDHLRKGNRRPPTDITCSGNSKSEVKVLHSLFSRQTSTPKHPTHLKPRLSGLTSDSKASINSSCPGSGFVEFKGKDAASAEPVTISIKTSDSAHQFAAKKLNEVQQNSKNSQSDMKLGAEQHFSSETAKTHCGDLAAGRSKTLKTPFHSLFASPMTDTLMPTPDSACPQSFIQSSCPSPQSADCRSKNEPDKLNSASSFLSLFASPLSESTAPLPGMLSPPDCSRTSSASQESSQPVDAASHFSESKPRDCKLETPLPRLVRTDEFSPSPKTVNDDCSTEHVNPPAKQQVNLADSLNSTYQQLPDISSHKDSSVAAASSSVLKTLFVCLGPYQQDQQDSILNSLPSENVKKDESSSGCIFVEQQRKSKKRRKKKKLKALDSLKQSSEKTVTHSTEDQHSHDTPQISLEATDPGRAGNFPFKAMTQPHTRQKQTSAERTWLKGNVPVTPLKDLFKTLDPTVSHFRY
ncbi:hypothetical protein PAMP_020469 [Pampus punctatissimus]